jgi:hypothetical protein
VNQPMQRQLRNVGNIVVAETSAHPQHRGRRA